MRAHKIITGKIVYDVYGKQAVRGVSRSVLAKYSIQEIMENREAISNEIANEINKRLKETNLPILVKRVELARVSPPPVIVEAQEQAAKRRIQIEREKANIQVKLLEAEGKLKVAKAMRMVEKEKALAIAEQNRIAARSITPQLLKYRQLEIAEKVLPEMAKSGNLIVVPVDMNALNTGSDAAIFGKVLGKTIPQKQ